MKKNNLNFDMIVTLYNSIFEQAKLQQEVRDRWFSHFLSIVCAISAMSALSLGLFDDVVDFHLFYLIVSLLFLFTGIMGICFFVLYMRQRKNYVNQYKILNMLEDEIMNNIFTDDERKIFTYTHQKKRRGSDNIVMIIENIICSICFAISAAMALLSLRFETLKIVILFFVTFVLSSVMLTFLYRKLEEEL